MVDLVLWVLGSRSSTQKGFDGITQMDLVRAGQVMRDTRHDDLPVFRPVPDFRVVIAMDLIKDYPMQGLLDIDLFLTVKNWAR